MNTLKNPSSLIEAHTLYLTHIKGYSHNTAESYERDIKDFAKWLKARNANARWSTVTREDVDDYCIHLSNDFCKGSTINRRLSAISSLYRFFQRQGLTTTNPTKYESRHKIAHTEPNTIRVCDLEKAIEAADAETALALTLLYQTGCRAEELLNMKTTDIDYQTGAIQITGKGSKQRTVFVLPQAVEMLASWMQGGSGKIFTYNDTRALRHAVHRALEPFSQAPQLSPHAIRHTFATTMVNNGMNTLTLARLLGHNDVRTTQKYVNMNGIHTGEQYKQAMTN